VVGANEAPAEGLNELTQHLLLRVPTAPRSTEGPFLFAVDHCFPIKGQGSVLTGTVLQGTVSVNQVRAPASHKSLRRSPMP
jgi:selenocysteine-specific elongation factor